MGDFRGAGAAGPGRGGPDRPSRLVTVRPLGGGTTTTPSRSSRLADGSRYVLKTAPPGPGLRWSRLLRSEEVFCRAAARARVPAPRIGAHGPGPARRAARAADPLPREHPGTTP